MLAILAAALVGAIFFGGTTFLITSAAIKEAGGSGRDLRVSVIRYYYSKGTHELISDLQFANNGSTRRTVLGGVFNYRVNNDTHMVVSSIEEFQGTTQSPVYVEPGQPIVVTYKHKLDDEKLTQTPGVVFGIQLTTIRPDGGMNFTSIEAMAAIAATPLGGGVIGLLTSPQRNISMDILGGFNPMEVPIMPPPPTPAVTPDVPPTLRKLFDTDFDNFAKFNHDGELHAKSEDGNIIKIKIAYSVYMDFASKSRFIGIYIASSPATYHACKELPTFYHEILEEADGIEVNVQKPGDSSTEHSKELTFTGKIYVYYEDDLTLEQLGSLEALFKSKNLLPQFRGQRYATTLWLSRKAEH